MLENVDDYPRYTKHYSPWHCYGGEINNVVWTRHVIGMTRQENHTPFI